MCQSECQCLFVSLKMEGCQLSLGSFGSSSPELIYTSIKDMDNPPLPCRLSNAISSPLRCESAAKSTSTWKIWCELPKMSNRPGSNLSGMRA